MESLKCVKASIGLVLVGVISSTILSCFKVDKTQQILRSYKHGSLIKRSLIPKLVDKLGLAQDLIFFGKFLPLQNLIFWVYMVVFDPVYWTLGGVGYIKKYRT